MTICLVFDLLAGIPQLSDDPAAIWRSCSLFVKHYDPRVGLLDKPHGHSGISVVEVPILLFQPSTSLSPMVKAGLATVNSRWFKWCLRAVWSRHLKWWFVHDLQVAEDAIQQGIYYPCRQEPLNSSTQPWCVQGPLIRILFYCFSVN